MNEKVRIQEIADELGISSFDVIKSAKKNGLDAKSAQSIVKMEEAEQLANYIINGEKVMNREEDNQEKKYENTYIQKIFFGHPACGKSHYVHNKVINDGLRIEESNKFNIVFHPEYSYGDFMGKLLPHSNDGQVEYIYYPGHFLKALAKAYKLLLEPKKNTSNSVCLVIDEINRGNSASIFGSIFQLLDREDNGWSSYSITLSNMEFYELTKIIFGEKIRNTEDSFPKAKTKGKSNAEIRQMAVSELLQDTNLDFLILQNIKIPPNFSLIGTMNTSDESIYYMDSAFKRRWNWEFVRNNANEVIDGNSILLDELNVTIERTEYEWVDFVNRLNEFILSHAEYVSGVEDKQIGYWFIKAKRNAINVKEIPLEEIKNKLLFFLWDNVYTRDKEPLIKLLKTTEKDFITFGDFQDKTIEFIDRIFAYE